MRVWKGVEKEVAMFQDVEMLFIQGLMVDIEKILELAEKNNIKYLYFGAGKTEFRDWEQLFLIPKKYKVIIETTDPKIIPTFPNLTIIYRTDFEKIPQNIIIKIEDKRNILTCSILLDSSDAICMLDKKLLNLETMMYKGDELLLEDKQ